MARPAARAAERSNLAADDQPPADQDQQDAESEIGSILSHGILLFRDIRANKSNLIIREFPPEVSGSQGAICLHDCIKISGCLGGP